MSDKDLPDDIQKQRTLADDEQVREGWETHNLRKYLNKMCENVELPEDFSYVIAPTSDMAMLLSGLTPKNVTVVFEDDGQYIQRDSEGGRVVVSDVPMDETVDLRLHGGQDNA